MRPWPRRGTLIALIVGVCALVVALDAQGPTFGAQIQSFYNQLRSGSLTLGSLRITAGTSTATYHPGGTAYWDNPNVSTTAGSTTWVAGTPGVIAANSLATNGDRLVFDITVNIPTIAAADNKSLSCAIGYSSFAAATGAFTGGLTFVTQSSASNQGQLNWHTYGEVVRLSATTAGYRLYSAWESGAAQTTTTQSVGWQTATVTWANAQNVLCAVGNQTGGNSQVLTLQTWRLTFDPR